MNSEELLLIKLQCVMYQWIRLYELYEIMKSFFFLISKFWPKTEKISNE